MAEIDVSPQIRSLLGNATTFALLPPELQDSRWWETSTNILDHVAELALTHPSLTDRVFAHFEPVFADIAARWVMDPDNGPRSELVVASFARILPFCPYTSIFLEDYVKGMSLTVVDDETGQPRLISQLALHPADGASGRGHEPHLIRLLLSIWRLLSFDSRTFSRLAPRRIESLFKHPELPVRYVAIRIFSQLFPCSDLTLDRLIRDHVGDNVSLEADFDGKPVDYLFLTLFEHTRAKRLQALRLSLAEPRPSQRISPPHSFLPQTLTSSVVSLGGTLVPRPSSATAKPSPLVLTRTTVLNLEILGQCLQKPGPILLAGLPGSGKTALVQEAARALGTDTALVTLHLNEQTDAKVLIGLYTSDSKPGSFQWRPGILTTAVREGRWVLIEDLDRAPTEVMSTLLPLIEHGELPIPSRGVTVRAPSSFRIFATVRTSRGADGQENVPHFLGRRFWQLLSVQPLTPPELRQVTDGAFPLVRRLAPAIMSVFEGLSRLVQNPSSAGISRVALERSINARDLFKWCRRLEQTLASVGSRSGDEQISDTAVDCMFLEAVDCFLGGVKEGSVRELLARKIGHEMHMSAERITHLLHAHIPRLEDGPTQLVAGRTVLRKNSGHSRAGKPRRPFASTVHARRLLEQVAVAVKLREPVLLVGETGIGKTTAVQQLADSLGHKLVAVNLSQQSEAGDLLGGFKPVDPRSLATPLKEEFEDLFAATGISTERNQRYLGQISKSIAKSRWTDVSRLWREAPKMFDEIIRMLQQRQRDKAGEPAESAENCQPAKRRKTGVSKLDSLMDLRPRWDKFSQSLEQFEMQISGGSGVFAFAFSEGNIVKAVRNGDWVLLDEINLASPDTLESIADLLQAGPDDQPSILLSETGEIERIHAHSNFRIFAAMNPATDVGKRDLPPGLRSRFTELHVGSPDRDVKDLVVIIKAYLGPHNSTVDRAADRVANLYLAIKKLSEAKSLVDGADEVPHFSLRTLTRVLTYANDVAPVYGLYRSLFEGFCMGFLTLLDRKSEGLVLPLIQERLFETSPKPPKRPQDGKKYIRFVSKDKDRQYWLLQGGEAPKERIDYIRTRYVERNLLNLVRATSTRRYPVLIQGPTSAGKTSMIEYLANYSGNKFLRINNHEHTDLQEYLGTYVSGSDGKLRFQEGILVQAMRHGSWIVLDELNLAPTDVLEALNRLLDDNRELLIPETQEVVRPHDNFMLFATQNPPGLYGGRKVLSRAFRNRFLELHFDDIPEDELEEILQRRCRRASPSDCRRIVAVYKELSRLRQTSRVFEQKDSFATLRDLFRWALRDADSREQVAQNGYMLLAERVRNDEERLAVKGVIESVFKVSIDAVSLYRRLFSTETQMLGGPQQRNAQGVIWTGAMRRLYVLVSQALRQNEPVLLVGETGCGKTSVCQVLAEALGKELHIVNAHQNTETGDLLGSQRPVRNRAAVVDSLRQDLLRALRLLGRPMDDSPVGQLLEAYHSTPPQGLSAAVPEGLQAGIRSNETRSKALFEWSDGSLVQAMKTGNLFLLDEISLADDSVLERLNSVLEPQRTLLLAEKGVDDHSIEARDGFQFLATMNPGGDFGKKELSPALRNRFTEIWVPPLSDRQDVLDIVVAKLDAAVRPLAGPIVDFSYWFGRTFRSSSATAFSIRDMLVWAAFANRRPDAPLAFALVHGAATVFVDSLGASPSALVSLDPKDVAEQRQLCLDKLGELIGGSGGPAVAEAVYHAAPQLKIEAEELVIGDFGVPRCEGGAGPEVSGFAFEAPTTRLNAMRVVRALQIDRPILLEGSPGVGKTTLVSALALACGRPLTRINLSDQTDLMDLFGTDVPVEGAEAGNFAWRDAPFLQAMQKGGWVLLDEMNLASQSVLEGLNACLDHRGEVYVAELDRVFRRHADFRLFAAQNPHQQGGGRKGLPSSFVNRFVVVYADVFTQQDQMAIATKRAGADVSLETLGQIIDTVSRLDQAVVTQRLFGSHGSPWEFNLRDSLRWLELLTSPEASLGPRKAQNFVDLVIRQRFRTEADREAVTDLFRRLFGRHLEGSRGLCSSVNSRFYHVGSGFVQRETASGGSAAAASVNTATRLAEVESLLICAKQNLPCILVGPSGSGKSALLQHVAAVAGKELVLFHLNADVDTIDLVGGFEQADPIRELRSALAKVRACLLSGVSQVPSPAALDLVRLVDDDMAGGTSDFDVASVATAIRNLAAAGVSGDSALGGLLEHAFNLLQQPLRLESPRFEWFDGVIVKAAQAGQWLVLDNANLCSASVLDRLNSLLERPGGILSINEHSGPAGEMRIITPHPDFRIFLTMDPRYGELSRAMRNRSVEIFVDTPTPGTEPYTRYLAPVESSMARFHGLVSVLSGTAAAAEADDAVGDLALLAADSLSISDASSLQRFCRALEDGLLLRPGQVPAVLEQRLRLLVSYAGAQGSSSLASSLGTAMFTMYSSLAALVPTSVVAEDNAVRSLVEMQPLHPLQDATFAALLDARVPGLPQWLGVCLELFLDARLAGEAMKGQMQRATISKPSSLTRFQRSCIAKQVAAVSRDSTAAVSGFLSSLLESVEQYLGVSLDDPADWADRRRMLRDLLHFWWRTFELVSRPTFEEAGFQAHLLLGASLLHRLAVRSGEVADRSDTLISTLVRDFQAAFELGFKLTTGLSMEILWNLFGPAPLSDAATVSQVVELERLATRFDSLRWRVDSSPGDLEAVASSLAKVYSLVRASAHGARHGARELLQALSDEITHLESKPAESGGAAPALAPQFEALRSAAALDDMRHQRDQEDAALASRTWMVLSDSPTVMHMRYRGSSGPARRLQAVDYLLGQDPDAVRPWSGATSSSLLRRADAVETETLSALRSLERELPLMGLALASTTEAISANPVLGLNKILRGLLNDVVCAHGLCTAAQLARAFDSIGDLITEAETEVSEHGLSEKLLLGAQGLFLVEGAMKEHLLPAMAALAASDKLMVQSQRQSALSSIAWVQFAIGCIKLYVPDKIFDPHLRSKMEKESHDALLESLRRKLSSLVEFERRFMDGSRGLRSQLLAQEIQVLDRPASSKVQRVYRPPGEEHARIQGEFNSVLKIIVAGNIPAAHYRALAHTSQDDGVGSLVLIQDNVAQLISRLNHRSAAYQDMTVPLVNFLRCLQVGLSLADVCSAGRAAAEVRETERKNRTRPFMRVTPLLGGSLWQPADHKLVPTNCLEFLLLAKTCASVEGIGSMTPDALQAVFGCFHFLYQEWSKRLTSEQNAAAAKSSLYRFRGSYQDEEEQNQAEFDELFPDYSAATSQENSPDKKQQPERQQDGVRDLSVRLAQMHREIFLWPEPPQASLQRLCKEVGRAVARSDADGSLGSCDAPHARDKNLLSAAVLIVEDKLLELNRASPAGRHNFYTDPHLLEARKLGQLVSRTAAKFRELQSVDEIGHLQPLEDVLAACGRVLQMGHTEPLAKMLPQVEKLHECLYEWQFRGYASRKHVPPGLYDEVTETIVGWRRLELSTWAKLFDSEVQRCRADADAWWFVAYQAVIAGPLALVAKEVDLRHHVAALLHELAGYLEGSAVGAFATRLDLLRQLLRHLDLLAAQHPALSAVRNAVHNLVLFYGRFEHKAAEAIRRGRAPLEKSVKDVLLLASWKDTNIVALRESSRKSHRKLFGLVRKLRAVLGQPMRPIIVEQGLPDDVHLNAPVPVRASAPVAVVGASAEAVQACRRLERRLGRESQVIRLSRAEQFVSKMAKLGAAPESAVSAPGLVDLFLSDTALSVSELRRETPAFLTDENKEQVKHLKSRKVRLFNDTLKTVRQMGFHWNLSAARLAAQGSVPAVLARMEPLEVPSSSPSPPPSSSPSSSSSSVASGLVRWIDASIGATITYQLDRLLDAAPKWRDAAHEHHGDLSRDSIQRSAGFLESILFVALQQREALSDIGQDLDRLYSCLGLITNVAATLATPGAAKDAGTAANPATTATPSAGANANAVLLPKQTPDDDGERVLKWLTQVLRLALHLVAAQAALGEMDNRCVQEPLQSWVDQLSALLSRYESLPHLPPGMTSSVAGELQLQAHDALQRLRADMDVLAHQRPDLEFVLGQIPLWTLTTTVPAPEGARQTVEAGSVVAFYDQVLTACQKVLRAIQNLSERASSLAVSADDASWFVDHSSCIIAALRSLHVKSVTGAVDDCFDLLRRVVAMQDPEQTRTAAALFAAALPVLQQYASVCRQTLAQLASLHSSTCRMGHQLGRSFLELASHGFCTPQEKSDETSGDKGKVEGGTGLGDGEGADNISKDIGADEDLSELAQDANNKNQQHEDQGEEEEDAVDMGGDELEGEVASVNGGDDKEEDGSKDGDEEEDMDEQAGDVDDLDPTAVDEKMWNDDGGEDADKDQKGDSLEGKQQNDNEQVGADETAAAAAAKESGAAKEDEKQEPGQQDAAEKQQDQEMGEELGPGEEEAKPEEELNRQDQNVEQSEALDIPEEMELGLGDGSERGSIESDDGLDDLSDVEGGREEAQDVDESDAESVGDQRRAQEAAGNGDEPEDGDNEDAESQDGREAEQHGEIADGVEAPEDELNDGDEAKGQDEEEPPMTVGAEDDQDYAGGENAAPSEMKSAGGLDQADDSQDKDGEDAQDTSGQREHGEVSQTGADQETAANNSKGVASRRDAENAPPADDQDRDRDRDAAAQAARPPPFKKLGDLLEKWYRNSAEIRDAAPDDEQDAQAAQDRSAEDAPQSRPHEFQHLQDEDAPVDTQALGAATDEEAGPVNDAMAIDADMDADPDKPRLMPDDAEDDAEDKAMRDAAAADVPEKRDEAEEQGAEQEQNPSQSDKERGLGRPGVTTQRGAYDRQERSASPGSDGTPPEPEANDKDDDVLDTSTQLSATHISAAAAEGRDLAECAALWAGFQTKTHGLSLALASQLRLILTPSQSTKLSGAFRTGKRLNIKKIIPYIASSYKRDKIWMRRSVPTKRTYQILLCVDDSLSMGGGAADAGGGVVGASGSPGALALESLVMVSRALTMLEAGQVGVLGFGSGVFAAHDLADPPFATPDAGARAIQRFSFRQDGTDVALLLRTVIDRFRTARLTQPHGGGGGGADLWQLALIMSDGLTPSAMHDRIRRLLREAMEERIMAVFIIMDGVGDDRANAARVMGRDAASTSVLDLKEAKFVKDEHGNSSVVLERYLDSFPFPYYLIVHRLDDLPGALAGLLRTWFSEVNS